MSARDRRPDRPTIGAYMDPERRHLAAANDLRARLRRTEDEIRALADLQRRRDERIEERVRRVEGRLDRHLEEHTDADERGDELNPGEAF